MSAECLAGRSRSAVSAGRGRRCAWLLLAAGLLTVTGCGSVPGHEVTQPGVPLAGRVHGGQQPVSGAAVTLYAAGLTGTGQGAVNLLGTHTVTTDANGDFSITGDYTCPSATTQVYLVARGGNPGLTPGTNNAALVMMASLGDCGALTPFTSIWVNEVTTVASAWALSRFLTPGALVGATGTNRTGLRNAFLIAANLADVASGVTPGRTLPAGAALETVKIDTLADSLANCVNSNGGSACTALFAAATTGVSMPMNTLDAALNIVRNPGAMVNAVFLAQSAQAPFQPALSQAPNDWTLSVTYGNCASCGGLSMPGALAIDSAGNVWVANGGAAVVSEFSPAGVPAAPSGFPGVGLHASHGLTIDAGNNIWVANEQSVTAANNSHLGSVSEFNQAGQELSGYGYTAGGVYYPQALAADTTGLIWVADYGNSSTSVLTVTGSAYAANGYAGSALPFTQSVALDSAHNAWFGIQQGVSRVTATGAVTRFPCCSYPTGVAIDAAGSVWLADYGAAAVVKLDKSGNVLHTTMLDSMGAESPQLLAVDGAGNVWTANFRGDSVSLLSGTTAGLLSPADGFGLDAPLSEPYGIAVDASGSLWLSNAFSDTVTQLVGVAVPVQTPLLGPPAQP